MSHGGEVSGPTPARSRMLRRIRRLGTAAVVGLLVALAAALLLTTSAVLVLLRDRMGPDVTLAPLVVPVVVAHLVLVGAASLGAAVLARRAARTVGTLFAHQDRVMLAIAHEVRSPLSRAGVTLDEGASGVLAPDRAIAEARDDVDEVADLIDDLLQTARVMSGAVALPQVDVRLDELVRSSVPEPAAGGPHVRLDARPALLVGSPHVLRRALINLVRNATVHAYHGGPGEIRVRVDEAGITVADDGPGVPAVRLEELRYETPLARRPSGSGLGLLIAGWAAEAHGGRLVLRNRDGGGFEARLELPARPVPEAEAAS